MGNILIDSVGNVGIKENAHSQSDLALSMLFVRNVLTSLGIMSVAADVVRAACLLALLTHGLHSRSISFCKMLRNKSFCDLPFFSPMYHHSKSRD